MASLVPKAEYHGGIRMTKYTERFLGATGHFFKNNLQPLCCRESTVALTGLFLFTFSFATREPNFNISMVDIAKIKQQMTLEDCRRALGPSTYPTQLTPDKLRVGIWEAKDGFGMIIFDQKDRVEAVVECSETKFQSVRRRIEWVCDHFFK